MTAIAERISKELIPLPVEEQNSVLAEVKEILEDLRAKNVFDAVKAGEMETYDSKTNISDMRNKYGL